MGPSNFPPDDDNSYDNPWENFKGTVTPFKNPKKAIKKNPPKISIQKSQTQPFSSSSCISLTLDQNKEKPAFPKGGIDGNTEKRLRKGKIPIDATFDLHGMPRLEAEAAIRQKIEHAFLANQRCIRIITGKGNGILRNATHALLNHLREQGLLIFFCHAPPNDGGTGVFYLLLKNRKKLKKI